MKIIYLMLFICIYSISFSQEKYKVIYDYTENTTTYYKLGKNNQITDTLSKPKFKKNSSIEIELKNVNPFALEVITEIKEDEIHKTTGGLNFGSFLSGFGGMTGDALKINPQNLHENEQFFRGDKSRSSSPSDLAELNSLIVNIDAIKKTIVADLANPNLNKKQIIENIQNIASKIDDVRLGDPHENFYYYLSTLDAIIQEYKLNLATDINEMFIEIEDQTTIEESFTRGDVKNKNAVYRVLQSTKDGLDSSTSQASSNIEDIQSLYQALASSEFDMTYDYQLDADKAEVKLQFLSADFSSSHTDKKLLKTREIVLNSQGGFKVNTSVALTLTNFGAKANDYYIDREGIIKAEPKNYFVPSIGAMINFYPVISESFNIGGSFGLSIPISDDINGINFLLGPSIYLGNENRVVISGGVAFGPVNRLTNGFKVDDMADTFSLDNYIKTVYDFGYFFGVSFSVLNVN